MYLINHLFVIFPFINNPISMMLIMLIFMVNFTKLNWNIDESLINFIISMVIMNGILILFMYMTSTLPNKKFKFSMKILSMFLMALIFMALLKMNFPFIEHSKFNFFYLESKMMYYMMLLLFMYLILTLIMTVKISNYNFSPLRKIN